jgi:phage antirepressor YoqD-like protein
VDWLLANMYLYRDLRSKLKPYISYVPNLWERNGKADVQTLVTPKGKGTIRLFFRGKEKRLMDQRKFEILKNFSSLKCPIAFY